MKRLAIKMTTSLQQQWYYCSFSWRVSLVELKPRFFNSPSIVLYFKLSPRRPAFERKIFNYYLTDIVVYAFISRTNARNSTRLWPFKGGSRCLDARFQRDDEDRRLLVFPPRCFFFLIDKGSCNKLPYIEWKYT